MNIEQLRDFFFWCMILNFGLYLLTVVSLFTFKGTALKIHQKLFGMDEAELNRSFYSYLAGFKLLTMVFAFVPWLALVIMN